jgi:TolB protein
MWRGISVVMITAFMLLISPMDGSAAPRRVAFGRTGDGFGVYVVGVDGSDLRRISGKTSFPYLNGTLDPDWSPGGDKIAFIARLRDADGIFTVDTDGTNLTRLSRSDCYSEYDPQWSPDGRHIAFRHDTCERMAVWMMRSDGSEKRNLRVGLSHQPAWRPDSRWVAFTRRRMARGRYLDGVVVARPDGSRTELVAHGAGANSQSVDGNFDPVFSPDGRWIAFVGGDGTKGSQEICVVRFNGTQERCLTDSEGLESNHGWSPNGRKIVFEMSRDGRSDIYRLRRNGTKLRRLTFSEKDDGVPEWSPDGRWIAFISKRDGNPELYVMRPDGSEKRRLTRSRGDETAPDWEPR